VNGEPEITIDKRQQILVIDDEDYVADMIAAMLELDGFSATVAYNGRDGLRLAQGTLYDLLIIDIMMPFMSGIQVIEHIRKDHRQIDIPIILISAGARPHYHLDGVIFIAKPFDFNDLIRLIYNLCPR